MRRALRIVPVLLLASTPAVAQHWTDVTADAIGTTGEWTSKVEVADLDGDGHVDLLLANGGDYASAGTPEPQRAFRNLGAWDGPGPYFEEISGDVFGDAARLSRVIRAGDLDGDGDLDLFVGGAHGTPSALYRNDAGVFVDVSASQLPGGDDHLGDAELGDVDGDGDLDLVVAEWGGDPGEIDGGPAKVWANNGDGDFSFEARLPADTIGMSWDLELVDVDDDADLDVLVSCKLCAGGFLYENEGLGTFVATTGRLPQRTNNYDYEPMDIDGDGDLDLATINDGASFRETVLRNDDGVFADITATALAGANNVANADDNVAAFLDVDSDGDADLLIGSLNADDRLLENDGAGVFTLVPGAITLATPGTLGLALADLDGDDRLDLLMGQGETADPDKVLRATAEVAADTTAPAIHLLRPARRTDLAVVARAHDFKSPSRPHDWTAITLEVTGGDSVAMAWRGEYLWTATLPDGPDDRTYRVCASDAAGNQSCTEPRGLDDEPTPEPDGGPVPNDAGPEIEGETGGCGCQGGDPAGGALALALALSFAGFRRRSRRGGSRSRSAPCP